MPGTAQAFREENPRPIGVTPLQGQDRYRLRVILMADQDQAQTPTLIDELLAHPLIAKGFRPLTREQAHDRE